MKAGDSRPRGGILLTPTRGPQAQVPGLVGWLIVAAVVATFDLHPKTQTMSTAFCPEGRRYGKPGYIIFWLLITAHLTRLLNPKYDPLRRLDLLPWKVRTA